MRTQTGPEMTTQEKSDNTSQEVLRSRQQAIESLLLLSFKKISLAEQLEEALDIVMSLPWLSLQERGLILLADRETPGALTLVAHRNVETHIQEACRQIDFDHCLCGEAARKREIVFTPNTIGNPQILHPMGGDHRLYAIPLIRDEKLLGVLTLHGEAGRESNSEERSFLKILAGTLALLIDRRETEERLAESEANLVKAQRIARLGYWRWEVGRDQLIRSEEVFRIFGTPARREPATFAYVLKLVYPDDRAMLTEVVERLRAGEDKFSIIPRIIRPDGEMRNVHIEGEAERGGDGALARIFGTVQDITELKRSEEQLQLAAKVFDNSLEGITITDAHGAIITVNRAFTHITGYTPDEVIGKNPSILKSDRHDDAFYREMWQIIAKDGQWQGEIWNRRKSGEVYPERLSITAISDGLGRTTHYLAVFHDLSEIHGYEEKLQFQAYHDALTALPNRLLFLDRLEVAVSHAQRNQGGIAVLVVDLDNFKHINDSLGHTVGDNLLQQAAERIRAATAEDFTVARLGGDDFAVLIEELDDERDAVLVAAAIINAFASPFNLEVYETFVTVSIGITCFPVDGRDGNTLLKNAELAMYRAKEGGKNNFQLFARAMNAEVVHRLSLENNLRKALERQEFLVYYQPKILLATGAICGAEALVRWRKQDGTLVSPLDFIPLAEETGLIIPLGAWVLERACRDAKKWQLSHPEVGVSVNLSPRQFLQKNLVESVENVLRESALSPGSLELEVTESAVMTNIESALELLRSLKQLGLELALDDFGTGYSSFQYLRRMPIDTLKIDRSFVNEIPGDRDSVAIAGAILDLARNMNLAVVAEGVENQEQLNFLRQHRCGMVQGFHFSPPIPLSDFHRLLDS